MDSPKILIVDDEVNIREGLRDALFSEGHCVDVAPTAEEALELLKKISYQIVVADLVMEGMDGIELTREIKKRDPTSEVVILTAYGSIETAVQALKEGAYDYLTKPVEIKRFRSYISKILDQQRLLQENLELKKRLELKVGLENIVGQNPRLLEILEMLRQVAPSSATILIEGESGTGKELIAKAIHELSPRKDGPFIIMNCGALPSSIFESELFGHEKGAFTNAFTQRKGCFELAHNGSLFLDEVAEMPLENQVDFLRVLEEGKVRRLGGSKGIDVDVRVIAASNRDLALLTKQGGFRKDLYFRLNIINLQLPPLRDRREDIPLLAHSFLEQFNNKYRRKKRISKKAFDVIFRYQWPGNVRELRNAIERAVLVSKATVIQPRDLPEEVRSQFQTNEIFEVEIGSSLNEVEKKLILETLKMTDGHREQTAKILGISLRKLHYRLKEYGIS